jgi:hypothetical protein
MKKMIQGIVIVVFMTTNAFAEEGKQEISTGDVFLLEAGIVFSAALLGGDRGGYSASMALLGPAGGNGLHGTELILFESLMAYNFIIDTVFSETFSDESVFWQNMFLMNSYFAYELFYSEDETPKEDDGLKMGLMPIKDGVQLSMRYQF